MAWNEPGGNKDKDPWGNKNNQDGPPDLDEIVRKIQNKFKGVMGGGGSGSGSSSNGNANGGSLFFMSFIAVIILIVWGASGIYIVDEQQKAVVLQFGKFKEVTLPGLHWRFPAPIEQEYKINVTQVETYTDEYQLLTGDENIIFIKLEIQYRVEDAKSFLFKVADPVLTLEEVTESALRTAVGHRTMDSILGGQGRTELVEATKKEIQSLMDSYNTGITIATVNLQKARPPRAIDAAVIDVQKAKEDQDRYKKEGQAYSNDVIPRAEGEAQSLREHASAYKLEKIAKANGETSRFLQTLKEYKKAPEITRKRLYIETMEEVLGNVSKVLVKIKQGNNIMYIPLQQIMNSAAVATADNRTSERSSSNNGDSSYPSINSRERGGR
ncbi:MAG: FtsH protease activity modulator HflK [Gammaproteobacteria bacterium]|nr:FtsH protease activity modulator HflK [Gammaproteobacteria bacterium]